MNYVVGENPYLHQSSCSGSAGLLIAEVSEDAVVEATRFDSRSSENDGATSILFNAVK